MPMKSRFWQMCSFPARQAGHVPSQASGMTVTASPTDQPSTPVPRATIVPDISCPIVAGLLTRPSMSPWKTWRSVPQIPTYATATRTSPARGSAGSRSSTVIVRAPT